MKWKDAFSANVKPDMGQISAYLGTSLWEELCLFAESQYQISPKIEYSICSMAPGWNVKYKKGGKAVCTLYPNEGFYTCMVCIGTQAASEAELILGGCTKYVRDIYKDTTPFQGTRMLMIDVTEKAILEDVKTLIDVRMKSGKKPSPGRQPGV